MAAIVQFITAGSDFDGLAPDGLFTSAGLFVIPLSGNQRVQARLKRIAYRTLGVVSSWSWVTRNLSTGILRYDAQTANFTVGATLTGTISRATAVIVSDADAGATGILTLSQIDESGGAFQNDEPLTDSLLGAATEEGVVAYGTQELDNDVVVTDYELRFDDSEGLVPNDPVGNPSPIVFVTAGMNTDGRAVVEFDYVEVNS